MCPLFNFQAKKYGCSYCYEFYFWISRLRLKKFKEYVYGHKAYRRLNPDYLTLKPKVCAFKQYSLLPLIFWENPLNQGLLIESTKTRNIFQYILDLNEEELWSSMMSQSSITLEDEYRQGQDGKKYPNS